MKTLDELIEEFVLHQYPILEQFVDSQSAICARIDEIFDSESAPSGWEQHWPPEASRETYKEVEMLVTEDELKLLSDRYIHLRNPVIAKPIEETVVIPTFDMKVEFGLLRTLYLNKDIVQCIDKKCTRDVIPQDQCFIDTKTNGIYCYDCGVSERYHRKKRKGQKGPPRKIIGLNE